MHCLKSIVVLASAVCKFISFSKFVCLTTDCFSQLTSNHLHLHQLLTMDISTFTDDCLLAIFSELPLEYRLSTVPLICRRWAQLQPLVRREITSVTLLSGDSSDVLYYNRLKSPFHLVDKRTLVTESPNLLQLSTSSDTADDVVERLQTELPNIRRLAIVQVNRHSSAFQPELLSAVEAYAGQLTSFAFYFQFKSFCSKLALEMAEKQPVLSADFYRLLSLINYGMPQLRHLLLNSDQSFFFSDNVLNIYNSGWEYKLIAPGILYLPVLRRLHTFSFKSPYHADILHYSLVKFASENKRLKLRLVHTPLSPFYEESTPEKLWKEEAVISHMDYLLTINFSLKARKGRSQRLWRANVFSMEKFEKRGVEILAQF